MSFLTGGGGKSTFERLLDSATSQMLLEPSWLTNLEICDSIRQQDITPKYALTAIQKRIRDPNPHVSNYALIVLETCVKNCGEPFHVEIAKNDFLDDLRTLAQTGSAPVKEQVLKMLQAWNHAFRNKTQYQPILATYNLMRLEGYKFPPLNESDAMFSADAAPQWKDGEVCHLCRVKFGMVTRQHHCRACGEAFCNKCSSKNTIIPKMGIEREVRVCDTCYDEINPNVVKSAEASPGASGETNKSTENDSDLPPEYLNSDLAKESQTKPQLSESEAKQQEEEELQLAMAISLSEEESKGPKSLSLPPSGTITPAPPPVEVKQEPKSNLFSSVSQSLQAVGDDNNAELNKYFDRSYWEKKNAEMKLREPSAPAALEPKIQPPNGYIAPESSLEEEDSSTGSDVFVNTMLKSIEMFTDRMNSVQSLGKHIAMDSTVQTLFASLSAMHPQLVKLIEDEEESKVKHEALLQKLSVIREARESLNDMRAQHQEKAKQQELEQEMLRRMQMEQKLELMRQQKQEYLEYQRTLQLQRQQDLDIYQMEKMRHKQAYGMNPGIPDYPGVAGPVPGTMQMSSGYGILPTTALPYGNDVPLQNGQLRVAQIQPSEVSVPYQDIERPPQYPGTHHQFIPTSVPEPSLDPPSYASAVAPNAVSSAPDVYGQPATSQWQQPQGYTNGHDTSTPKIRSQSQAETYQKGPVSSLSHQQFQIAPVQLGQQPPQPVPSQPNVTELNQHQPQSQLPQHQQQSQTPQQLPQQLPQEPPQQLSQQLPPQQQQSSPQQQQQLPPQQQQQINYQDSHQQLGVIQLHASPLQPQQQQQNSPVQQPTQHPSPPQQQHLLPPPQQQQMMHSQEQPYSQQSQMYVSQQQHIHQQLPPPPPQQQQQHLPPLQQPQPSYYPQPQQPPSGQIQYCSNDQGMQQHQLPANDQFQQQPLQQPPSQQQYQQQQLVEPVTGAMKDMQLISFD